MAEAPDPLTLGVIYGARPQGRTVTLGDGQRVPYPEPTSEAASRVGRSNRRVDSVPEVRVRSAVHAAGLRFRKDMLLRAGAIRTHADLVFTKARVAVFIDGCFWHGCPLHGRSPRRNDLYWRPKLFANQCRDRLVTQSLTDAGWHVLRIWEHVPVEEARAAIVAAVRAAPGPPHS